jgi:hypothetical protein
MEDAGSMIEDDGITEVLYTCNIQAAGGQVSLE